MDEFLFYLDNAIVMWFIVQISYSLLVLVLGNVMMEYYEWALMKVRPQLTRKP